jgi:hypothetical protein
VSESSHAAGEAGASGGGRPIRRGRAAGRAAVWLVPAGFGLSAVLFWFSGRGLIDKEGVVFIRAYLADRPLLSAIFDPRVNDFGAYQAREASYALDYLNVQWFAWLHGFGVFWLVPLTGILGLVALAAVHARGSRRLWRVGPAGAALTLGWVLSGIVVQASTGIFYRSAKIAVAVLLLALLYRAGKVLLDRSASVRADAGVAALGLTMALLDRQGVFFLLLVAGLVLAWHATSPAGYRPPWRTSAGLVGALALAAVCAALYNRMAAPAIIAAVNGYQPDFSYQQLNLREGLWQGHLWRQARAMVAQQAGFLSGGLPGWVPGALVAAGYARHALYRPVPVSVRLRLALRDLLLVALAGLAVVTVTAVMILRHPFLFTIPDHAYWYTFVPMQALVLFGVTGLISGVDRRPDRAWRAGVWTGMIVLAAGNAWGYPAARQALVASRYLSAEHARTARLFESVDRAGAHDEPSRRFVSAGPDGLVLRLPLPREHSLADTLDLRRAARRAGTRTPRVEWSAVLDFLRAPGSPVGYPDQLPDLVEAWRRHGVRHLRVEMARFATPVEAAAFLDVLRATGGQIEAEHAEPTTVVFTLAAADAPGRADGRIRRVAPDAFVLSASHQADRLPLIVDRDVDTRWVSGDWQTGDEWLAIAFDGPRDVARVRMDLERRSFGDYPRQLRIEGESPAGTAVLYEGSVLPALLGGLVGVAVRAPIVLDLPPNRTSVLRIRQTGASRVWYWSVHEIAVWTRVATSQGPRG